MMMKERRMKMDIQLKKLMPIVKVLWQGEKMKK
jgi:hypothetical protein